MLTCSEQSQAPRRGTRFPQHSLCCFQCEGGFSYRFQRVLARGFPYSPDSLPSPWALLPHGRLLGGVKHSEAGNRWSLASEDH